MEFKSGKFGWQASKPNQKVRVALARQTVEAQVFLSSKADVVGKFDITTQRFLELNPTLEVSDIAETAEPYEFQTSSWGWHAHRSQVVTVGGEALQVIVNFQAVLKGTKQAQGNSDALAEVKISMPESQFHKDMSVAAIPETRVQTAPKRSCNADEVNLAQMLAQRPAPAKKKRAAA